MTLHAQQHAQTVTKPLSRVDILPDIKFLKAFIGQQQIAAMGSACYDRDEKDGMIKLIKDTADKIRKMPVIFDQEILGDDAIIYLHYFNASMDFYITEKDNDDPIDEQYRAYGLSCAGSHPESGYISILELIKHGVELDLYWAPITIKEAKAKHA